MNEQELVRLIGNEVRRIAVMLKSAAKGSVHPSTAIMYARSNLAFLPGFIDSQVELIRTSKQLPVAPGTSSPTENTKPKETTRSK